jgi:hypothetical protein
VCGSSARTDLCGGRSAMIVPTATETYPNVPVQLTFDKVYVSSVPPSRPPVPVFTPCIGLRFVTGFSRLQCFD